MRVALVVVAKSEDYYLDEWLDYNHKIGFDKIIMYQNDWRTDIERPFLEKRVWDGKSVQLPIYNSFLDTDTEYDWVAFFDCDEFLVLRKHDNVKDFINDYKDKTNVIGLNWYFYGSFGLRTRTSNSLLRMFSNRNKNVDQHVKVMVNTKSGQRMNLPHNTNGPATIWYYENGNKFNEEYCINGKRHRNDGPAVICPDGHQEWYLNDKEWNGELIDVK
jgi:hypothetical protein